MPAPAPGRPLIWRLGAVHLSVAVAAAGLAAADPDPTGIDLTLSLIDGFKTTKDQVMMALWIEDGNGRFVRTVWRFGKAVKWYKDLTVWSQLSARAEKPADLDAVTGATVIWGSQAELRLPARWQGFDLLGGDYVLRIESAKDHAKHYSSFSIPLTRDALGKTFTDKGYVKSLAVAPSPGGVVPGEAPAVVAVTSATTPAH